MTSVTCHHKNVARHRHNQVTFLRRATCPQHSQLRCQVGHAKYPDYDVVTRTELSVCGTVRCSCIIHHHQVRCTTNVHFWRILLCQSCGGSNRTLHVQYNSSSSTTFAQNRKQFFILPNQINICAIPIKTLH